MKKTLFFSLLFILPTLLFAQKTTKESKNKTVLSESTSSTAKPTSATERMAGFEQRTTTIKNSLLSNLKFRNIGPTVMSGRVVAIDANPDKPTEFYVAYASGGLWHTVNNGQSFQPLFDHEAVMTIGDIAVDWKTHTIWVGTGENNSSRSSYSGVGIYKSSDEGKTWQQMGLNDSQHIGRIVLHPTNPSIAWVAVLGHLYSYNAERGIYKTIDGGKTWQKTLYVNERTGGIDLKIDPSNPDILYSSLWHRERTASNFVESGNESNIYKSTDGGTTWKLLTGEGSGFVQGEGKGRIGIAIYPKNPQIVYAIIDNQTKKPKKEELDPSKLSGKQLEDMSKETFLTLPDSTLNEYLDANGFPDKYTAKSLKEDIKADKIKVRDIYLYNHTGNDDLIYTQVTGAEVYRSEDGGTTWKRTHQKDLEDLYYTYGYYFGQIWVAPNDDKKLVIVGVPILLSSDGGKAWKNIENAKVHSDHHALWIDPKDSHHFIDGNDGGINITYDSGKNWFKANSIPVGQFYAVAVDMEKPYHVYGGLQDNGVWYGSSDKEKDFNYGIFDEGDGFKFLLGGDGMQVQVDWRDNTTVYAGSQFGSYSRINRKTGETKELDVPREVGEVPYRFNWEAPILLSRHNQDILYFGSNKFHRSLDKGETFITLSGDLTHGKKEGDVPYGSLTTIEESPLHFGLLYVGSDDGLIHVSKDGGYTWAKIMDKPDRWVSGIAASKHSEGKVYVSYNGYRQDDFQAYLYASDDFGATWRTIGSNLPAEPINVVREDPKNENILYVGTDHGLYISLDKGETFMNANGKGLPAVAIHDLQIHPRDNELIVGTHGRSIYVADIQAVQAWTKDFLAKDLVVYDLSPLTYSSRWGKMRSPYEEPMERKYPISYYAKKAGKATLKMETSDGVLLKTIVDEAEAGLNYVNFDQAIDSTNKENYTNYLHKNGMKQDKQLKAADDKKYYFQPGKYKLIVELNGAKEEKDLLIKAPIKTTQRSGRNTPDGEEEEMK